MNDCTTYWGGTNSLTFPLKGPVAYCATPYSPDTLHSMRFMDGEAQRNYTALRFPRKAEDSKGQQIQKMNYDIFIRTMADLIKKYSPKIQNQKGV